VRETTINPEPSATPIPPRTVVRLVAREADWDASLRLGDTFRIGYYSPNDGLDCVWLVNCAGIYEQTWDQASLLNYFEVVTPSDDTDLFGIDRPRLEPIA
jgi:hypothetical protein